MAAMRLPWWLKIGWTVWLLVWAPLYWHQYGPQNFLYFCDIGNILSGVGLWLESPLIVSWVACGVLLFRTLFTMDLLGTLLTGHHVIGGTEYMFDPHLSLAVRLLSLFHLVTPPLLLWAIWRLGYDPRGWKLQTVLTWIVIPINYYWRPEQNVNWARGLFYQEQHFVTGLVYLFGYLVAVPLLVYFPTHVFVERWATRRQRSSLG